MAQLLQVAVQVVVVNGVGDRIVLPIAHVERQEGQAMRLPLLRRRGVENRNHHAVAGQQDDDLIALVRFPDQFLERAQDIIVGGALGGVVRPAEQPRDVLFGKPEGRVEQRGEIGHVVGRPPQRLFRRQALISGAADQQGVLIPRASAGTGGGSSAGSGATPPKDARKRRTASLAIPDAERLMLGSSWGEASPTWVDALTAPWADAEIASGSETDRVPIGSNAIAWVREQYFSLTQASPTTGCGPPGRFAASFQVLGGVRCLPVKASKRNREAGGAYRLWRVRPPPHSSRPARPSPTLLGRDMPEAPG